MRNHIVIIENDEDVLEIMRCYLEQAGYVVTGFTRFPSMAELVFMHADCFIVDEWLPNVSGHAICLMIKAKTQTKLIPVILTSMTNPIDPVTNLCEADAMVSKACISDDLVRVVSAVLSMRRMALSKYR